jgi:hypothetical protein
MMSVSDAALVAVRPCLASCGQIAPVTSRGDWFGIDPTFHYLLEHSVEIDVEHRGQVTMRVVAAYAPGAPRTLQYRHAGVSVPSRRPVPVLIEFPEYPAYATYGRPAQDYPRVFADLGAESPHRMDRDDSLCLYHPHDPSERTWSATDGLALLFNMVANHLFFETHWRATGGCGDGNGNDEGIWLADEAPHGSDKVVGRT